VDATRQKRKTRRSSWPSPVRQIERMIAQRRDPRDVLDVVAAHEAHVDTRLLPALLSYRIWALDVLERGDDEVSAALDAFQDAARDVPLKHKAGTVISTCVVRPELAARILPSLIDQLEAELSIRHDNAIEEILAAARRHLPFNE
jgi:hypothetical protein